MRALSNQRSRGSKRPIVFFYHCLGGSIVERALLTAQLRESDYLNIFMSVVGCIFLGTPSRGTKSQSKATLLAETAETVELGVNFGLLRVVEEGLKSFKIYFLISVPLSENTTYSCFVSSNNMRAN